MDAYQIIALLTTCAALFSYLNYRVIKLPTTIGLMLIALLFSLGLIVGEELGLDLATAAEGIIARIDFDETLLQGMLRFLLFAGALLGAPWDIGKYLFGSADFIEPLRYVRPVNPLWTGCWFFADVWLVALWTKRLATRRST